MMISWFALVLFAGAMLAVAAVAAVIIIIAVALRSAKRARDEAMTMQSIHCGIGNLDERVESLETLVQNQDRSKHANLDRELRTE